MRLLPLLALLLSTPAGDWHVAWFLPVVEPCPATAHLEPGDRCGAIDPDGPPPEPADFEAADRALGEEIERECHYLPWQGITEGCYELSAGGLSSAVWIPEAHPHSEIFFTMLRPRGFIFANGFESGDFAGWEMVQ